MLKIPMILFDNRDFIHIFSRKATGFLEANKTVSAKLRHKKNCPVDCETRLAKSSPQLVNLPGNRPLMTFLFLRVSWVGLVGHIIK